jgi:hypothetical protein
VNSSVYDDAKGPHDDVVKNYLGLDDADYDGITDTESLLSQESQESQDTLPKYPPYTLDKNNARPSSVATFAASLNLTTPTVNFGHPTAGPANSINSEFGGKSRKKYTRRKYKKLNKRKTINKKSYKKNKTRKYKKSHHKKYTIRQR